MATALDIGPNLMCRDGDKLPQSISSLSHGQLEAASAVPGLMSPSTQLEDFLGKTYSPNPIERLAQREFSVL